MKTTTGIAWLLAGAALAACGGGGGDGPTLPPTNTVPDSANASTAGMVAWLKRLTATAPQDAEALDASRFAPPQPDGTEPEAL